MDFSTQNGKWSSLFCFYDHLCDDKKRNFEQHRYSTPRASSKHFFPSQTRTNIRKFYPTVISKYYWNDLSFAVSTLPTTILFKKQFSNIILFNIDFLACLLLTGFTCSSTFCMISFCSLGLNRKSATNTLAICYRKRKRVNIWGQAIRLSLF